MSSFDVAAVAVELRDLIKGSRITKIYQIDNKTLLLNLRNPGGEKLQLLAEAGRRVHLTSYDFKKPERPPNFCMALRKYLENGVVREVNQYDFERIIEFLIERGGQSYRLIIEVFERGNIILVGSESKILQALVYRRMKDRNILRGEAFRYPPQRGISLKDVRLEDVYKLKGLGQMDVVRGLVKIFGIGGLYAEEILLRSGVDKGKPCALLSDEELNDIFNNMRGLVLSIEQKSYEPHIYVGEDGEWVDVAPFKMRRYSDLRSLKVESLNKALDEYYIRFSVKTEAEEIEDAAKREISALEKVLEEQRRSLEELRSKANYFRRVGDTIYSHIYEIDQLLSRIMDEKRLGNDWEEIARKLLEEKQKAIPPSTYFISLKPESLTLQVSVDGLTFDLNLRMSAQQNAAEYYGMAKRAESKISGVEEAIKQTIQKIEEAKAKASREIEEASKPHPPVRRREWFEKFRWFFSSEGFLVIGGRDASTNEVLIRKYMEENDMVFHADVAGSPFVVIKTQGKEPSEATINEAAQFTASYSRAWRERLGAVDVYWVKPSQVSKSPPSGEYLPKGSFMIYGARNYIRNVPLALSIGVKYTDDGVKVIGGPSGAIAKQTNLYVNIVPGDMPSGRLAKEIRQALANMAPPERRKEILEIPLEEFQAFIPSGMGRIAD